MKTLLFAAALSISGVALAQSQTTTTTTTTQSGTAQPSGETVDDPSQSTGPQGVTQQGTDPEGRATAPAGTNQMPMQAPGQQVMPSAGQGAAFTPRPAAGEYPPCSRTVTDGCTQTYERGVRRSSRRR